MIKFMLAADTMNHGSQKQQQKLRRLFPRRCEERASAKPRAWARADCAKVTALGLLSRDLATPARHLLQMCRNSPAAPAWGRSPNL